MAVNKGIITAFSLLVSCGVVTAVYLLYISRTNSQENVNAKGLDINNNLVKNNLNGGKKTKKIIERSKKTKKSKSKSKIYKKLI